MLCSKPWCFDLPSLITGQVGYIAWLLFPVSALQRFPRYV